MPPFTERTFKRTLPLSLVVFFIVLVNLIMIYRYIPYGDDEPDLNIPPPPSEELPPYNPPQYELSLIRPKEKKFTSPVVEKFLKSLEPIFRKDKDLYTLLQNCLPNTLDTTVEWINQDKKDPRSFLITGDSNVNAVISIYLYERELTFY